MKKLMILLQLPTFAIADPDLVPQHFKNAQATLFDLGMFRLEIWATQYQEHIGATYKVYSQSDPHTVSMHASYDAD